MKVEKLYTVICGVCALLIVIAGYAQKAEMKLSLEPQSQTTYKVVTESGKDYEFIQPSINKTKVRHTGAAVEMIFTQNVESIEQDGSAIATITIKELKYTTTDSQGKEVVLDSTKDKSDPLMKLIGASYKIKISPQGAVSVLDASEARKLVKSGSAQKIASRLLSDEEIARRHQVMAFTDAQGQSYNVGDEWNSVVASPAGMLRSKSFEKVYTLKEITEENEQKIATIEMNAVPSSKRVEGADQKDSGMGMFATMFDEKDNYTGKMKINLTTGEILNYNETLQAEWTAAEPAEEQKSDKGPDQLTMGFTYIYSLEKVD